MPKAFHFYGASDDLVEVRGAEDREYNVVGSESGYFTLTLPDGTGCRVHVRLEDTCCWSAGAAPIDEETEFPPNWILSVGQSRSGRAPSYSAVLTAEVDDEVTLTWEGDQ